nr:immunity 49 family protein [Streptomyces sp. SID14478]
MRALVADHLHVPVFPGDTVEADGRRHLLAHLARRCRRAPEDTWPGLVEEFFAASAAAAQGGDSAEELLTRACLSLVAPDAVPADGDDGFAYLRDVAEGLRLALALDGPDSATLLTDQDVARAGADALWAAGQRNLVRAPLRSEEVRLDGHAVLYSVYGDSPFVSTKALVLPELVAEVTGRRMPDAGALVAVPTRHLLAFHPIVDGGVADAVNDLATYAFKAHEEGPGPLSPRVYWWHEGRLTSLTTVDRATGTLSLRPPEALLDIMQALRGLDRAGRLASAPAGGDLDELARTGAALTARLDTDPGGRDDAFAAVLALAHAHAATDPDADRVETWDAWVAAQRLGTDLFAGTENGAETGAGTGVDGRQGDARAWLDAYYLTLVTRARERTTQLCRVPLDDLRGVAPVDDYVLHWIDVLQSHWLGHPMDDVVHKLVTTIETSHPDVPTLAPKELVNRVEYQPVALFHRMLTQDHDAFGEALTTALAQHGSYWGAATAPRARVALGPLALACLAYDMEFPVATDAPHLPKHLLDRQWLEKVPAQGADRA